ncbi:MAG: zinc ribbon domain-containing protein [Candidatus Thermoplasmatota archaeon]|nr:zinc ribbon domain-containing protein [Candidatus Thermoplasmatota archaeon]
MVKCPSCGSDNPTHVSFCGRCGAAIPYDLRMAAQNEPVTSAPQEQTPDSVPMKKCNWCGELNKWNANYCTNCGRDPHGQPYLHAASRSGPSSSHYGYVGRRRKSGLPVAGGILAILAGVLALVQGLLYLVVESVVFDIGGVGTGSLCFCGGLDIVFGLASFASGILAIQRRNFWLSILGAVLGMLGLGFLIGALFGLLGLILIAVSREEFSS